MRRIGMVGMILLILVLLAGCNGSAANTSVEPTPTPVLAHEDVQIQAEARVLPIQSTELVFQTSGIVAEILVQEGDSVVRGAPLARLEARDQELRVAQAQAELTRLR